MYKTFRAIAAGSIASSVGILHFDPENDAENGRYQEGVMPADAAEKAVTRGLIEITGDAEKADYDNYLRNIAGDPVGEAAARRVQEMVDDDEIETDEKTDDAAVSNINAVAFPKDLPARTAQSGANFDPDAAPVGSDAGGTSDGAQEPGPLDQSIDKLTAHLETIEDVAELDRLREQETGGKSRAGALAAIDARKAELEG